MCDSTRPRVAIVDYGLGNLFSVQQACEWVGLHGLITAHSGDIASAAAVILPGVGAFPDAMKNLRALGLLGVLRDVIAAGTPLVGICLGMQLLMSESLEFGHHAGLGVFGGDVARFDREDGGRLKVPQVGWNRLMAAGPDIWRGSLLDGTTDGEYVYFVHSFYARPSDPEVILSTTTYGTRPFCSSLRRGNVFGCQFHPERSGRAGLRVYRNLASTVGVERGGRIS